jgi:pimeloyl-ACP methyl ester carboxylesterase
MPYAKNAVDGRRVYFEDDGGTGPPVVIHGGLLDSVPTLRTSDIAKAISGEFRVIYVDHRGLGRSDKPHEPEDYAMFLRVKDAVAVLDELRIERSHFVGLSWGARLGFGIGQHEPDRVLSLVMGGNQPYAWPDSPLTRVVTEGLMAAHAEGMEALISAMERFWNIRFPDALRAKFLDNDPAALEAAWTKVRSEGPISEDLRAWRVRCLIFLGAADADFLELARRAAEEIPNAEFMSLQAQDHIKAHMAQGQSLIDAVMRTLRA